MKNALELNTNRKYSDVCLVTVRRVTRVLEEVGHWQANSLSQEANPMQVSFFLEVFTTELT